ncbi:MAG: hypothetical protein ACRDJH_24220 [Thermomicrobiales bacterium]
MSVLIVSPRQRGRTGQRRAARKLDILWSLTEALDAANALVLLGCMAGHAAAPVDSGGPLSQPRDEALDATIAEGPLECRHQLRASAWIDPAQGLGMTVRCVVNALKNGIEFIGLLSIGHAVVPTLVVAIRVSSLMSMEACRHRRFPFAIPKTP